MRSSRTLLVLTLLAHAAACAPSVDTDALELEGRGVLYRVRPRTVDAAHVNALAARFGLTAPVEEGPDALTVTAGGRMLLVQRATGGVRFLDVDKLDAPTYRTTLSSDDALDLATRWLADRGLLPAGAQAEPPIAVRSSAEPTVLEEDDRGNAVTIPAGGDLNHWQIRFQPQLLTTTEAGLEVLSRIDGVVIAVQVGAGEIIGLDWDMPDLVADDAATLYTPTEARGHLPPGIAPGQIADPTLVYHWDAFSDAPPPVLAPRYGFPAMQGVAFTEATAFVPRLVLDAPAGVITPGAPLRARATIDGGTPPYQVAWRAWEVGTNRPTVLGTDPVLDIVRIPDGTQYVDVEVTDGNGMIVTGRRLSTPHILSNYGSGPLKYPGTGVATAALPWRIVGTTSEWRATYAHTAREALALKNVDIAGQRVMETMSLPYFWYVSAGTGLHNCYLGTQGASQALCRAQRVDTQCWNGVRTNGVQTLPCNDPDQVPLPWQDEYNGYIPTKPYHLKTFNNKSMVIKAVYEVSKLEAPEQQAPDDCKLMFQLTYIMAPKVDGWADCGSADGNPCWRFYPIVQYWYANATGDDWCQLDGMATIGIGQRYVPYLDNGAFDELAGYVNDDDLGPLDAFKWTVASSTETGAMMAGFGAVGQEFADNTTPSPLRADNIHARDAEHVIYVPGCYRSIKSGPGFTETADRRCFHAHWNWGGLNWLLDLIPGNNWLEFTGTSGDPGVTHAKVPGSQGVETKLLKYRASEVASLPALVPQGSTSGGGDAALASWKNLESLGWFADGDLGTDLQIFVQSQSSASQGYNGIHNDGFITAEHYDQFNMNDYFFE